MLTQEEIESSTDEWLDEYCEWCNGHTFYPCDVCPLQKERAKRSNKTKSNNTEVSNG